MKIRWRLKVRLCRNVANSFLKSCYHDPRGTIRLLLAIPSLWIERRSEYEYVEPNPQTDALIEKQDIEWVREFKLLFDSLPLVPSDFGKYFDHFQYSEKEVDEMFSYEETQRVYGAGLPYSRSLLRYGLTPFNFFEAVDAVGGLLKRLRRHGLWDGASLHIDTTGHIKEMFAELNGETFRFDETIVLEIANMTEQGQYAKGLWRLILAVLRYRPYFIEGYEAHVDGDMTILKSSSVLEPVSVGETPEQWFKRLQKRWRIAALIEK